MALVLMCSCDENEEERMGSIYGVVTDKTTIEPMRGTGVELHASANEGYGYSLLTRTVTYDDGHYEF